LAAGAVSVGTGQDRYSEMRIEIAAPRRARHRGQRSRVRKGARRWIVSPQLGQCIYDIDLLKQGCAHDAPAPPPPSRAWRTDKRSGPAGLQARTIPAQPRGVNIARLSRSRAELVVAAREFYRGASRQADFDVCTRTSASGPWRPVQARNWRPRPTARQSNACTSCSRARRVLGTSGGDMLGLDMSSPAKQRLDHPHGEGGRRF
jgi:hypothetical protein